ncbi:MgtC/SapB family protein [Azospirillum sp. SYSU D00513]|uniref:MgtC/SapB family protein n=1 Tax=Azospirillum sp. SYSU D00513 TaxID=2812561 RepID=UPI001B3BD442|nr:MgtC/SapB family protein [Azospirillum sp. SYSU D00513]
MEGLWGTTVIPFEEMLWRLGIACGFGLLIGLDREVRGISAGVRTHMLVALSSAVTMLIALELFEELSIRGDSDPDPTRAIQGLAQAIGFLCAGTIFVSRGSVYGLTTAASLWMSSTIGMAAGAGQTRIAVAALLFALVIMTVMWLLKRWGPGNGARTSALRREGE